MVHLILVKWLGTIILASMVLFLVCRQDHTICGIGRISSKFFKCTPLPCKDNQGHMW